MIESIIFWSLFANTFSFGLGTLGTKVMAVYFIVLIIFPFVKLLDCSTHFTTNHRANCFEEFCIIPIQPQGLVITYLMFVQAVPMQGQLVDVPNLKVNLVNWLIKIMM